SAELQAKPARRVPKLGLLVAVVLVVGAVLVMLNFKRLFQWPLWINGAAKEEYRAKIEAEQDPDIIPKLVAAFRDPEKSDDTRLVLANVLIDKKNRRTDVENALRSGS